MEAVLNPRERPVRVLIVDDEPLFVETLEALLDGEDGIQVVGTAQDGKEAVGLTLSLAPDVILMDISMPFLDGIEASRQIRDQNPEACILILTGSRIASDVDRSRQAGASGFHRKDRLATPSVNLII